MWRMSVVFETLPDTLAERERHTFGEIMALSNPKQCETRHKRARRGGGNQTLKPT